MSQQEDFVANLGSTNKELKNMFTATVTFHTEALAATSLGVAKGSCMSELMGNR